MVLIILFITTVCNQGLGVYKPTFTEETVGDEHSRIKGYITCDKGKLDVKVGPRRARLWGHFQHNKKQIMPYHTDLTGALNITVRHCL